MKKAICLGIVLSFLIVFFSFSVNAAVGLTVPVSVNSHYSSGDIDLDVTATKLVVNADSVIQGGGTVPYMITARIRNSSTTQDALISNPAVNLYFDSQTQIMNYENYSPDLMLSVMTSNTSGTINPNLFIFPSNEFSYGGSIVIPKNSCLYLVSIIYVTCTFDVQNQVWTTTSLTNCSSSLSGVSMGDYDHGSATDLSPVISVLNDIESEVDDLESLITSLINVCSYTGSYSAPDSDSYLSYTYDVTEYNIRYFLRNIIIPAGTISYDFELNSSNDQTYQGGYKRYIITSYGLIDSPAAKSYAALNIRPPVGTNSAYKPYVVDINSNFISDAYFEYYIRTRSDLVTNTGKYIMASGPNYFVITMYLDVPLNVTPDWRDISTSNPYNITTVTNYTDEDVPFSEQSAIYKIFNYVKNLYNAYINVNGTGDVSTDSGTVGSQSDSNHTIEESYYSSNSDAILATGLSNYRFSNDQSNGIGSVSIDFTSVWNALGSFNSVYIFSLTLSIALMIFRHVPGVIRGRFKTRNDGDG